MTPDLSRRVARAFMKGFPTPAERDEIVKAIQGKNGFRDLPDDIQELIEELEDRPAA